MEVEVEGSLLRRDAELSARADQPNNSFQRFPLGRERWRGGWFGGRRHPPPSSRAPCPCDRPLGRSRQGLRSGVSESEAGERPAARGMAPCRGDGSILKVQEIGAHAKWEGAGRAAWLVGQGVGLEMKGNQAGQTVYS